MKAGRAGACALPPGEDALGALGCYRLTPIWRIRPTVAALAAVAGYAQARGAAPGAGCGPAGRSPLVDELTDIYYNKISKNNGGCHEHGKPARETTRIC